jgi:hypothetical protein
MRYSPLIEHPTPSRGHVARPRVCYCVHYCVDYYDFDFDCGCGYYSSSIDCYYYYCCCCYCRVRYYCYGCGSYSSCFLPSPCSTGASYCLQMSKRRKVKGKGSRTNEKGRRIARMTMKWKYLKTDVSLQVLSSTVKNKLSKLRFLNYIHYG